MKIMNSLKPGTLAVICTLWGLYLSGNSSATGLPGEYILSDQWRAFSVYYSALTNPALVADQNYTNFRAVASLSQDNSADLFEFASTMPVGLFRTAALSVIMENGKNVRGGYLTDDYLFVDDSTAAKQNNRNVFVTGTYATNPWKRLSMGLNVNLAYQGNFGKPSAGFGLDAGLTYRVLLHPVWGYHVAGLSLKNIVAPSMDVGMDLKKMKFPFQMSLLYHSELLGKKIIVDCQYDIADFLTQTQAFKEGKKTTEWNLKLQASYRFLSIVNFKGFTQFSETKKLDYWGFATGLNMPQANNGRDLEFLYQFRDEITSNLRASHTIYFRADIGKHREEVYARKMARVASLSASDLYNRAMDLYSKKKFWDAFFVYQRIVSEYPDFFRNDMVSYYAGICLEKLDMRENADKIFESTSEVYSASPVVAAASLGRMRIAYRQAQYDLVKDLFRELNIPAVPDSIRQHACYIMGESELRKEDPSMSLQYFQLVPESHPDYVFAQNSSATAHALRNSETSLIVQALENCVSVTPKDAGAKEIINRAFVLLGYIFYEENAMSKAVVSLREVTPDSYYYEDALLGQGWSAIKSRQWNDCKNLGQQLMNVSKKRVIQCEGALLQSYSMMMEQKYTQAQMVVQIALEKMRNYEAVNEDSMNYKKLQYENNRMAYTFLADDAVGVSRKGAAASAQEISALQEKQIAMKGKIDEFLTYEPEYKRLSFFARNATKVLEDLEYADATIQKIIGSKAANKLDSQEKAINVEIEKLKLEMEKIQ
jgi:tetratricopeptide (TPR) repeat protein